MVTTSQTSSLNVDDDEDSSDDFNSQSNSVSAPTASNHQLVTAAAVGGGQNQEGTQYNCLFDASKETSYKPIPYSTKSQSKHLNNNHQ